MGVRSSWRIRERSMRGAVDARSGSFSGALLTAIASGHRFGYVSPRPDASDFVHLAGLCAHISLWMKHAVAFASKNRAARAAAGNARRRFVARPHLLASRKTART